MRKLLIAIIAIAIIGMYGYGYAIPPTPPSTAGAGDMTEGEYATAGKIKPATGGTGLDTSGSSGYPSISAGTWSILDAAGLRSALGLGTIYSLNTGTLTNTYLCTYVTGTGLVCNTVPTTFLASTVLDDTKGNGDTAFVWSADKVFDQLALKQAALSLVKGTYTNTYLCTYTTAGTLLDCNTNPASFQTADPDLTYLAGFTPSDNVKTILNAANNAAIKTALGYYTAGDTIQTGSATSLPGTCTVGQLYIDTNADTDGSLYICVATNTWKEVDDDGGAGGMATTDIDTSSELVTIVTDETGSAAGTPLLVFNYNPTLTGFVLAGDVTQTAGANDWDMIDNNASALSFDTAGKAGILEIVTTDGSEGIKMSGTLTVTGAITGNLTGNASGTAASLSGSALPANSTITTSLAIGSDPADTGSIRLPNAGYIYSEADATGTDISVIGVDSSEVIQVGASGAASVVITPNTTVMGTFSAGSAGFSVDSDGDVISKSITVNASPTPATTYYDSDGVGAEAADKEAAKILVNMETTTEDSEDGKISFQVMVDGAETTYIAIDGNLKTATITPDTTITGDLTVSGSDINVGSAGVKITGDGDGAITFLGLGGGYDEDLTINLDDTENTAVLSSSTGVTKIDYGSIGTATTGTVSSGTLTPVIDDPDNFAANFTTANLYGGTFIANAAGTAALPAAAVGMNFTVVLEGANAVILNPDGTGTADTIYMNGLEAAQDENITSSTSGAMCIFQYRSADHWMATCNGFAEATPP